MTAGFALRGNSAAEECLRAFAGRGFPHALLIEGPEGGGKSSFARRAAMAVLCRNPQEAPCGQCPSCKKVAAGIHPDLHVFEGEKGKARSLHIDQIRALRAQAFIAPNDGERKALLIEDAQNMTEQAQNALLKILEEPPASAVLLLTCRSRGELLETILSRVTLIALRLPDTDTCAAVLRERCPTEDPARLYELARDAGGSVGIALALLESGGGAGSQNGYRARAAELLTLLEQGAESKALALLSVYEKDRPGLMAFLDALARLAGARLLEPERARMPHPRLMLVLAAVEETQTAAYANVSGLLAGSALVARVSQGV